MENSSPTQIVTIVLACTLITLCHSLAQEKFSKGLEWAVSESAKGIERDKYVVDYGALAQSQKKIVSASLFLREVDEMCKKIIKDYEVVNAPEVRDSNDPFAPANYSLKDSDLVSLKIQQTAVCCRLLHEEDVGKGDVRWLRKRSQLMTGIKYDLKQDSLLVQTVGFVNRCCDCLKMRKC